MYAADSKTYEWPLREMMGAAWSDLPLPEAQQILLALKYVAAEQDTPYSGDEMLFEILHFGWFGIPAFEVARLCAELAGRQFGDKKTSLRKLLQEKINAPARDLFSTPAHSGLHKASRLLEKWIAEAGASGLPELLEQSIGEGESITRGLQSQAGETAPDGPAPAIEPPERSFVTP
ncbi:MAG TPA: hypothetical protein VLD19_00070, partial [Chitinophagaceae bacterium]|nr:hypothetical protein [Chitinophagaceae bacterium]